MLHLSLSFFLLRDRDRLRLRELLLFLCLSRDRLRERECRAIAQNCSDTTTACESASAPKSSTWHPDDNFNNISTCRWITCCALHHTNDAHPQAPLC